MKKQISYLFALALLAPLGAAAHPGRTDASGCHTCRTNCAKWGLSTGEYHCHQSTGLPQPVAPIHSVRETATTPARTIPAPEYVIPKAKPFVIKKNTHPIVASATSSSSTLAAKPVAGEQPLEVHKDLSAPPKPVAIPSPIVVHKSPWYKRIFGF